MQSLTMPGVGNAEDETGRLLHWIFSNEVPGFLAGLGML